MSTTESVRIHNDGVTLHLLVDGPATAPPVVLLHGITSNAHTWDWLVPNLAEQHRVVRLDFRGHGLSDRTPGAYDMHGYTADAVAACAWAGASVVVIGHSLGGVTAASLAQTRPDLVRAAVLEDPPIGPPRGLEGNSLLAGFRVMRDAIPLLQATGAAPEAVAERMRDAPSPNGPLMGELLFADGIVAMAGSLLQVDAAVLDPVLEGRPLDAVFDRDRPLTMPVLLVAADSAVPGCVAVADDVRHFATVNPHAQVLTVQGAGHLIHDELAHRAEFQAAVEAFLAGLA